MIDLVDVSFSYNNKPLLSNVNMHIAPRDFVGLLGANGSGKTTLVKLILGLLKPAAGTIKYSLNGLLVDSLAIGYLPQISRIDPLFPISVSEVVALGLVDSSSFFAKNNDNEAVVEAMRRVDIAHLAEKPIGCLSGGELQRALLARAIVSHPQMLILDEPDTYLDKRSEEALYSLLKELNSDCAILVVTHSEQRIKECTSNIIYVDELTSCE